MTFLNDIKLFYENIFKQPSIKLDADIDLFLDATDTQIFLQNKQVF